MPQITRRDALTAALGGAVAVMAAPVARGDKTDDRLTQLVQKMESFRTELPPPQGRSEENGFTCREVEPYTVSHLSGVASRLGVRSRAECLALLTYLKDPDAKLRFIAAQAIDGAVDGYRNGIDSAMDNILDTHSAGHLKMARRFVELVDQL